jgi:hypothetical protein
MSAAYSAPPTVGSSTGTAPADITQCSSDCSAYSRVLPLNRLRVGSGWKNDAEIPISGRFELTGSSCQGAGTLASARISPAPRARL